MQGYLDAGASGLIYYESEVDHGNGGGKTQLALANNASADSGSGKLSIAQGDGHGGTQTDTFTFAYNDSYYLRSDTITNTPQCFSRKLSDAKTSVWRYGLYDMNGGRVDRNSGFQITFDDGGQTYQGNVGYFGLWLSDGKADTIADGAVIKRQAFGGNQPAKDYTLVKTGGKLSKYTRQQTTLDKIQNVKLQVSLNDGTDQQPNWHQYEVYWDGTQFQKSGVVVCGNNGCTTSDAVGAIANSFWAGQGGVFGFSQSLGGQFAIRDVTGLSNPASEVVSYRIQDVVYPGEAPAKLYCASDCFDSASLNGYFVAQSSQSPFMTGTANQEFNLQGVASLVSYTPAVANGLLTRDGENTAAVLTDKQAFGSMFNNGIRTGKLVPNGSALACAGNPQNYCASRAEDLDVYYVWETGPGAWNQFAAIKPADGSNCEGSSSAICKFEAPLNVTYHVPADSTQFGEYAGTTLILQYAGFGQLWGIPGKCFSAYTNQPTSCDQPNARYVPAFSIPMDAATGLVSDGSGNYLVKWLDREVRFGREPSLANCQTAGFPALPTGIALPDGTAFRNPGDPATADYIGAPPDITATPRVIDGVVKY